MIKTLKLMLFIGIMAFTSTVKAQDTIVKMDGTEILSKVLEITPDYIKYKNYHNQDGPLISLHKRDVHFIIYQNGIVEVINEKRTPTTPPNNNDSNAQYSVVDKDTKTSENVTYAKVTYQREITDNNIYKIIKLNPLMFLVGEFPVYYEHRIADRMSLEVSAGLTFFNYVSTYYFDGISEADDLLGYSFSIGTHLYPSKYYLGPQELYFNPKFSYKKFSSSLNTNGGTPLANPIIENQTYTDFLFIIGYIDYYWYDNVCFDYYAGIGLRSLHEQKAVSLTPGSVVEEKTLLPTISIGVKIGYGW